MRPASIITIGITFIVFALFNWVMGKTGVYEAACFLGGVLVVGLAIGLRLALGKENENV